jgi:hypothetical protein
MSDWSKEEKALTLNLGIGAVVLGWGFANWDWLILDSRVLTEEPRGATIVSDSRSCVPSKGFGCCDGRHRPSAGTDPMASPQMINLTSLIDSVMS